jgi:hypothetical protein
MNFNMEFRHDNIHFTLPNGTAIAWGEQEKNRVIAEALDQAL